MRCSFATISLAVPSCKKWFDRDDRNDRRALHSAVIVSLNRGFRFVQSAQFVRQLSETVVLSNSLLDGFGEPSYESIQIEKLKIPAEPPTNGVHLVGSYYN